MPDSPPSPPTVFVSYSYDSKEHKAWVAKLAGDLLKSGIEVLFDQYDLGPGDDVPKFMESAVSKADRVLMICTEPYVRKADDGKGGVGYEAMIVTSELVRNLGTNKFIPIIRQKGDGPKVTPICVSSRKYVDLSHEENWDEGINELIEDIHRIRHLKKPPLGKTPHLTQAFEGEERKRARIVRSIEFSAALSSPEEAYNEAITLIQHNNRITWRKLLLAASDHGVLKAKEWMGVRTHGPTFLEDNPQPVFEDVKKGVEGYTPFLACIIAASESGEDEYANQLGWIDAIFSPSGWKDVGPTYFVKFPETMLFISQAFVGGMLMQARLGDAAYRLAASKVNNIYENNNLPIFSQTGVNGWPDVLGHRCTTAWQFLDTLIDEWGWLKNAFGGNDACRAGITGYYMMMNFLNFVTLAKSNSIPAEPRDRFSLSQPFLTTTSLCCLHWPEKVVSAGYKLFASQRPTLEKVLSSNNIEQSVAASLWTNWMKESGGWLANVYSRYGYYGSLPHKDLFKDWDRDPYSL